jgi:protease II
MTCRKFGGDGALAAASLPSPRAKLLLRIGFLSVFIAMLSAGVCATTRADGFEENGKSLPAKCPPATRQDDVVDTLHGAKIADPYRWLEDQDSAETRAWIEAQDAYTAAVLDAVPARSAIRGRLGQLMKVDSFQPPMERKMTARLQAANRSDRPILLLYDTKSGHSGGRPLKKQIEERTDILSFLYSQLGMSVE